MKLEHDEKSVLVCAKMLKGGAKPRSKAPETGADRPDAVLLDTILFPFWTSRFFPCGGETGGNAENVVFSTDFFLDSLVFCG